MDRLTDDPVCNIPAADPAVATVPPLLQSYGDVRAETERLAHPLSAEDCAIQSMPDVSPTKWHLAHTTWFFETFVLERIEKNFRPFDPAFRTLFNSYYETVGPQHPRPRRGLLSRPGLEEVLAYRRHVDERMERQLGTHGGEWPKTGDLVEIGLQHEQQHQELLLMDIQHVLSCNPTRPAYRDCLAPPAAGSVALRWIAFPEGRFSIGHDGSRFAYDNEKPRHEVLLRRFDLAARLVTNAEYMEFMTDGGYHRPEPWLSDGWDAVRREQWEAPLYWVRHEGEWIRATLTGTRPVRPADPVAHVSYFEADAFARWAGARLPTEAEWECAAAERPRRGNFLETGYLQPAPAGPEASESEPEQMYGDLWEWTSSPYAPYPGYRPPAGALGEYNGKFMCNQMVLRGGCCATPRDHIRPTYRNFYYPHQRWMFGGIRLARD